MIRRTPAALFAAAVIAVVLAPAPVSLALLQDAPAAASAPAGEAQGAMKIVVNEVKGLVQVRTAPDQPWKKAEAGMELTEGAEFRTGPKSSVVCTIPPDQTIVLDRLGTVKVAEAIRTGNKVKTDLVMKYGRTDYAIEAAGREHESTIRSPSSTLAVRGTSVRLYDQPPFTPQAQTFTGHASYQFAKRQLAVGKGGTARGGAGSAETALLQSVVDPNTATARTTTESALIAREQSRGAVVSYDQTIDIPVVRGGPGPRTDTELMRALPGVLNFDVRWTGNADVDLVVTVQPGDPLSVILGNFFEPKTVIFPGFGLQTAPSGGRMPYDHRGGPNGGEEICFWPGVFPSGVFGFGAINNSQDTPADVRFNAYLNGEKLTLYTFNDQGAIVRSTGFRRTIAPDDTDATIALSPPVPQLEDPVFGAPEVPDETVDGTVSGKATSNKKAAVSANKAAAVSAKQAKTAARAQAKLDRQQQQQRVNVSAKKGR